MKAILLAGAMMFAGTAAIAQDMTAPQTPPPAQTPAPGATPAQGQTDMQTQSAPADMQTPPATTDTQAPAAATPAPMTNSQPMATPPAPAQPMAGQPMAMQGTPDGMGTMTKGGYMPAQPPIQGGAAPAGAQVVVQPSMSPSQAFPPPAPKQSYPICKKGQTDGCRQRGG